MHWHPCTPEKKSLGTAVLNKKFLATAIVIKLELLVCVSTALTEIKNN